MSKSNSFDGSNAMASAVAKPPGLATTAYSFEVLDAVVGTGTIGDPCPAPTEENHSAVSGSNQTILVCGRNRMTVAPTLTEAHSSLIGEFVDPAGTFASASIPPGSESVILTSWSDTTITSSAGERLSVVARAGASPSQTSPFTRLDDDCAITNAWCLRNGGYEAMPSNTGTTAIGTPTTIATTTVGENAVRSFAGTGGQQLTLAVSGNTFSGGVTLTVRAPSSTVVTTLTTSEPTAFLDAFSLPVTGTYSIDIDPAGQQTGTLTFLLGPA